MNFVRISSIATIDDKTILGDIDTTVVALIVAVVLLFISFLLLLREKRKREEISAQHRQNRSGGK